MDEFCPSWPSRRLTPFRATHLVILCEYKSKRVRAEQTEGLISAPVS
jgi:hypothetical protein